MKNQLKIEGTPTDIGTEAFIKILMPVVREASKQFTPAQLAQMYAGFIGACFGSMTADFGKENAQNLMALKLQSTDIVQEVH
jgi:hypothetical protein